MRKIKINQQNIEQSQNMRRDKGLVCLAVFEYVDNNKMLRENKKFRKEQEFEERM